MDQVLCKVNKRMLRHGPFSQRTLVALRERNPSLTRLVCQNSGRVKQRSMVSGTQRLRLSFSASCTCFVLISFRLSNLQHKMGTMAAQSFETHSPPSILVDKFQEALLLIQFGSGRRSY